MKQFSLEEYLKNPSKKIVTRDGRNVTIHCTNCAGPRPVVAQIEGDIYSLNFDKYGRYYFGTSDVDLFFSPEKHEGYINIYKYENLRISDLEVWKTKEEAKKWSNENCIATVKIEWEE